MQEMLRQECYNVRLDLLLSRQATYCYIYNSFLYLQVLNMYNLIDHPCMSKTLFIKCAVNGILFQYAETIFFLQTALVPTHV